MLTTHGSMGNTILSTLASNLIDMNDSIAIRPDRQKPKSERERDDKETVTPSSLPISRNVLIFKPLVMTPMNATTPAMPM